MTEAVFFDTNVLLYMYDRRSARKQQRAVEVFRACLESGTLVISTQVVQEFYVALTGKLSVPPVKARELVADLCELPLVSVEPANILRALDFEARYQLQFWDALILAAAEASGASTVFSEDLGHGQSYNGIKLVNPFVAG